MDRVKWILVSMMGLLAMLPVNPAAAANECFGEKPVTDRIDECMRLIHGDATTLIEAALLERGRIYLELERYDEALTDLDNVTRLNPKSHRAFAYRNIAKELTLKRLNGSPAQALREIEQGHVARLKLLDEQIRQNPKSEDLFTERADVHIAAKRYAESVADLDEVIALNPNRLESYWERARINYFFRDKNQAFNDLARAVAIDPQNPKNYLNRLPYYQFEENDLGLISDYGKLIEFGPLRGGEPSMLISLLHERAAALGHLEKYDEAIADMDRAITLDDTGAGLYDLRGYFNAHYQRNEQALKDYGSALRLSPGSARSLSNRCALFIEQVDFQSARADCGAAIKSDPKYPNAYKHRGVTLLKLGQRSKAIADIDKAIELNPKYAAALVVRAELFESEGKAKEAIDRFEQALSSPVRRGNYDDQRARVTAKTALERLKSAAAK